MNIEVGEIPYSENGVKLVQTKYNWQRTALELQQLYQKLENTKEMTKN